MAKYLSILVVCSGCVLGGGPVVGYGKKKGFYAGLAGYGGISVGQLTLEVGGTKEGPLLQTRLDAEGNKLRFKKWPFSGSNEDTPYPGLRAGIGFSRGGGGFDVATTLGPDVGMMTNKDYCEGSSIFYVGIDWRYVGGEQQLVIAPRYETLQDLCFR